MGHRVFIWYNDEELKKLVAKNGTDVYKDLVQAIKKESLNEYETPENFKNLDDIEDLKLRKLKAEVIEKESFQSIKKRKLEAETKIAEYHAEHVDVIGANPSNQARKAMDTYTNHKKIVQPDGSFKCPRCGLRIAESEIYKQVDKLYFHVTNDHNSKYTEAEQAELLKVIEN